MYNTVETVRQMFKKHTITSTDKTGVKMRELLNVQFIATEPTIYGKVNDDWNRRELDWFLNESLNTRDIEPPIPKVWQDVSDCDGYINSNYGWCVFSGANGSQYDHVLNKLKANPNTRQGQIIYTRPTMHTDWNRNGMSDFMCCSNTVHQIRDGLLVSSIYFRSQDAVYGYKGDYHWMKYVHDCLAKDLNVKSGDMFWNVANLHVYEKHFHLMN